MGRSCNTRESFRRVGEERSFLKSLKIRRAKLIGHTLRQNHLLGRITEGWHRREEQLK